MNLKTHLIHLLGGITPEEQKAATNRLFQLHQNEETRNFFLGQWTAYTAIKTYADTLYGINADDWSKAVYQNVADNLATATRTLNFYSKEGEPSPTECISYVIPVIQRLSDLLESSNARRKRTERKWKKAVKALAAARQDAERYRILSEESAIMLQQVKRADCPTRIPPTPPSSEQ